MTGRLRGDAGQVAGIESIPFGLLVLIVGILLVAHTWAVVDAKFVATAAAREATRAYVESTEPDAAEAARRAAADAVDRSGRTPASLDLRQATAGFGRCVRSRFEVAPERPDDRTAMAFRSPCCRGPGRAAGGRRPLPGRPGGPSELSSGIVNRDRDRGTTLLFFPAALLVMVVLASITVDFARLHLGQRQADDLAAATANDAVTVGLDETAIRSGAGYRLDVSRVDAVVAGHLAGADRSTLRGVTARGSVQGARSVTVTVAAHVPLAFAHAVPGTPASVGIRARATATAQLR